MKLNILVIHGFGPRSYQVMMEKWKPFLENSLGQEFEVHCPEMPIPHYPQYHLWKKTIEKEINRLKGPIIFIGHSLGGAVLLKFITESKLQHRVRALYLVAVPYFSATQGWNLMDFFIKKNPGDILSEFPVFSYHSKDDEVVPVTHQGYIASQIPHAIVKTLAGHGHEFNKKEFKEIIQDIRDLKRSHVLGLDLE